MKKNIKELCSELQSRLDKSLANLKLIKPWLFEDFNRVYLAFCSRKEEPSLARLSGYQREELDGNKGYISTIVSNLAEKLDLNFVFGHEIIPSRGTRRGCTRNGPSYYTFIPIQRRNKK